MEAAMNGDASTYNHRGRLFIRFVVRTGYKDVPELDEDGKPSSRRTTAVHYAARRGHFNLVPYLFKIYDRFDVNYTDKSGFTHFHAACRSGCDDVVQKFLELGQNLDCPAEKSDTIPKILTPLHLAAAHNREKVAELLLRKSDDPINDQVCQPVEVDALDYLGRTPLQLALAGGHKEMTTLLLGRGADPNLPHKTGTTPLHIICKKRCFEVVLAKIFFEINDELHQPIKIDAMDKSGQTPLHVALVEVNLKVAELLLRRGADSNLANQDGSTPLHIICHRINKDKVYYDDYDQFAKLFFEINDELNRLVQVDARDKLGRTPLHLALKYDLKDLIELLLTRDANPNLADADGSTLLHIIICKKACDNELTIFLKKIFNLIDAKHRTVQVDTVDKFGRTPLQWAVARLLPNVVDALLSHGADVSVFVFPTESHFDECFEALGNGGRSFKLTLASGMLAVIDSLAKKGYKMNRSDAITIMKLFDKHKLFDKSENLDQLLRRNDHFASKSKSLMINSSLSLYELIRMGPEKASKLSIITDFLSFEGSGKLYGLAWSYGDSCVAYMCEITLKGFYQRWTLDIFLALTQYQLPIICCEKILKKFSREDLFRICLAAEVITTNQS
ncbi:unnamed protein product [Trichogramma brassicae]|uniref:Uncharacterized protein n=1 Tax=Trichogramma brassicae TaxID=86971 RepID=A0A6H5J9G4_9HYME|nr:unnamed protein product [Trichogramma brassicae]